MLSINDLDVAKLCDTPYEFEITDDNSGKGTGVFLSVIGAHSSKIIDFIQEHTNAQRVSDAMAAKRDPRNKEIKIHKLEEDIAFSTELVALRIVAWRGISDQYSHDNAMKLCRINPPIKEQVLARSENLANFMSPFSSKPASSSAKLPG